MQRRRSAFILGAFWLFFAGAVLWHTQIAPQPFPFTHIDEQAHYSYTMDLIRNHRWWPDFDHFPMTRASSNEVTEEPNYVNHPPQFYWLMKLVQQAFPDADPIRYRIVPLLFYLVAFGIYARLGWLLELTPVQALLYIALPILLYAPLQSGYYNNDGPAICGGMLACLGSWRWFQQGRYAFALMLFGLTLASVKLTAFLLVGLYVAAALLQQPMQLRALRWRLPIGMLWTMLLALPFLYFWWHDGSPAPNFIGQDHLMKHNAVQWGWMPHPDTGFFAFLLIALPLFADQFSIPEWTFLPLLWLIISALFFARRPTSGPTGAMARTVLLATFPMLAVHMVFAYARYRQYGWLLDMFVRYYFPLLPAYGALAVASLPALRRA